jgi:hypothetical protein
MRKVTAKPSGPVFTRGWPSDRRPALPGGGFDAPVKAAPTDFAASIVSVHELLAPEHAPLQPRKLARAPGVAANVTLDPWAYDCEQVFVAPLAVQLPPGPDTVPLPLT